MKLASTSFLTASLSVYSSVASDNFPRQKFTVVKPCPAGLGGVEETTTAMPTATPKNR